MASKVTRPPSGLLSLVGTKTLGQNPDALSELVRPVINLDQHYLLDQPLQTATATVVGGAIGTFASVQIPSGELWAVYNVAGQMVAAAVDTPGFYVRARGTAGTGVLIPLAESQTYITPLPINGTANAIWNHDPPVLYGPSMFFDTFNFRTVNAATTFAIRVSYRSLTI